MGHNTVGFDSKQCTVGVRSKDVGREARAGKFNLGSYALFIHPMSLQWDRVLMVHSQKIHGSHRRYVYTGSSCLNKDWRIKSCFRVKYYSVWRPQEDYLSTERHDDRPEYQP